MKQLENIFRTLFLLVACVVFAPRSHAATEAGVAYYDSVEIGLVTCTPHDEIYSLYGHAALRLHDLHTGDDISFNYGVFNYSQRFFVLRFVFGKTDYELGISPFHDFCKYYERWGSGVTEQVLNLSSTEKRDIIKALAINYMPENRVYRYNFFYDNCATRPRDIIEQHINGQIKYANHTGKAPSFREMIHDHTAQHPWAAMGNDLLLGLKADCQATLREQHFLPENLAEDFDAAQIIGGDGVSRPLVLEKRQIVPPGVQLVKKDFPLTPTACGIILLVLSLAIALKEWKSRRTMVWWDGLLMTLTGIAGCLIVIMFFSEHPTTSTNLQVLLLNPLHLFFLPAVLRRRPTRYWKLLSILVLLFLLGGFLQDYAEGMTLLASCLLSRYVSRLVIETKRCQNNNNKKK